MHLADKAVELAWPDLSPEELGSFKDRLAADLSDGTFTYVVAAQKLTDPMATTARYLNAHQKGSDFLVEVVRFTGEGGETGEVFEARTVLRPEAIPTAGPRGARLNRSNLMDLIGDEDYASAIARVLDAARAPG